MSFVKIEKKNSEYSVILYLLGFEHKIDQNYIINHYFSTLTTRLLYFHSLIQQKLI